MCQVLFASVCTPVHRWLIMSLVPETLFYDGHCGLCHRSVRFLLRRDPGGRAFRFAPLQGRTFQDAVSPDRRAGLPDSMVLKTADGRLLLKSDAWLHILRRLGGGLRDRPAARSRLVLRFHRRGSSARVRTARPALPGRASRASRQVRPVKARILPLRTLVIAGLLAGFLLSPKLWTSARFYPQTPVWSALHPLPVPFDRIVFGALLLALIAGLFARSRLPLAAFLVLAAALAALDQSGGQPGSTNTSSCSWRSRSPRPSAPRTPAV